MNHISIATHKNNNISRPIGNKSAKIRRLPSYCQMGFPAKQPYTHILLAQVQISTNSWDTEALAQHTCYTCYTSQCCNQDIEVVLLRDRPDKFLVGGSPNKQKVDLDSHCRKPLYITTTKNSKNINHLNLKASLKVGESYLTVLPNQGGLSKLSPTTITFDDNLVCVIKFLVPHEYSINQSASVCLLLILLCQTHHPSCVIAFLQTL